MQMNLFLKVSPSWRFAIGLYFFLRCFYALLAWAVMTVYPLAIANVTLFGQSYLTIFDMRSSARRVYSPYVENVLLAFAPAGRDSVMDLRTGSLWNAETGRAVQGYYTGKSLVELNEVVDTIFPYHGLDAYPQPLLAVWQRFDAIWYVSIAERGYGAIPNDVHFPPLYPWMIRALAWLVGDGFLAGMLISSLATILTFKLLYDLFLGWGDEALARRGVMYFAIFPTSFFLFSAYTEGLLIATVVLALSAMKNNSWLQAGFWIGCAILFRLQGVALFFPLLYHLWKTRKTERWISYLPAILLPALTVGVYLLLRRQAGVGIVPLDESGLHARITFPWVNFIESFRLVFSGKAGYIDGLNLLASLSFLVLMILGWKRMPLEYGLFALATFVIFTLRVVDTQPLNSMIRYLITLFPLFYVLAEWGKNGIVHRMVVYLFFALNLFLCVQFWAWGWVA